MILTLLTPQNIIGVDPSPFKSHIHMMKQQITHMASLTCRTTGKYVPSCSVYRNCVMKYVSRIYYNFWKKTS